MCENYVEMYSTGQNGSDLNFIWWACIHTCTCDGEGVA